jgi:hypothetical protein
MLSITFWYLKHYYTEQYLATVIGYYPSTVNLLISTTLREGPPENQTEKWQGEGEGKIDIKS